MLYAILFLVSSTLVAPTDHAIPGRDLYGIAISHNFHYYNCRASTLRVSMKLLKELAELIPVTYKPPPNNLIIDFELLASLFS